MSAKTKPAGDAKSPTVDVGTLARLFNLTAVRVQQLAKYGVIVKADRGRYDLWLSIKGYIKFLQERRVNQWDGKEDNMSEIKREQLRRTREEADKLALANARSRGELVEIAAVKKLGEKVMVALRNKVLNMPLTDEEKDRCLVELLDLGKLDWSREG